MLRISITWLMLAGACAQPADDALAVLDQDWASGPSRAAGLRGWDLVDQTGAAFDETRFAGRWTLVFVGYTSCPDVCPTTLAALGPALETLGDEGVRGLFVAVDPVRDRPRLPELVRFHGAGLTAATGEVSAIDAAVAQLGASYTPRPGGLVDHSTPLFLVDPTGHVAGFVLRPSSTQRIVEATRAAINAGPAGPSLQSGWVRQGPADATVLAGFGEIVNPTDARITVTGVSGSDFGMAHLHETVEANGVARMQGTAGLTIDAGGRATLAPGGHHMMLMRPQRPLSLADETVVRLDLDGGDHVLARLRVRPR